MWVSSKKYGRVSKVPERQNKIRYCKVALHIISYYTIKFGIILIEYYIDANNTWRWFRSTDKNEIVGKIGTEKWLQCTPLGSPGNDTRKWKTPFSRLYRPLTKCFTWFGCLRMQIVIARIRPSKRHQNKTDFSWGFPELSPVRSPDKGRRRKNKLHMDPMDLETRSQVDRLRCWRERASRGRHSKKISSPLYSLYKRDSI